MYIHFLMHIAALIGQWTIDGEEPKISEKLE